LRDARLTFNVSYLEDSNNVQPNGEAEREVGGGAGGKEGDREESNMSHDTEENVDEDGNNSSNGSGTGADADIDRKAEFEACAYRNNDGENDANAGANVNSKTDGGTSAEDDVELGGELNKEGEDDRDIGIGIRLDGDLATDVIDLLLGALASSDEIVTSHEGRHIALLGVARNGDNFADSELRGKASSNSDFLDAGSGCGDGEEAEGEDSSEDGTETHFE